MNNIKEMDAFIKKIAKIHFAYPNYVSKDTIYHQLMVLGIKDDIKKLRYDDIQMQLRKKFANSMINSHFVWLNVKRNNESFNENIPKAIKLYVSLPSDKQQVFDIVSNVWQFMIDNNIEMQSKLSKIIRTDALVIRVCHNEDLEKVINFINGLNYKSDVNPNCFLYNYGKIGITRDSATSSYNSVLASTINRYLHEGCSKYNDAGINSFNYYLQELIRKDNGYPVEYAMLFDIVNGRVNINSFINNNLDNTMKEEDTKFNNVSDLEAIINKLKLYYKMDEIEKIIIKYIDNGNDLLFTRKSDIRADVKRNFDKDSMKRAMQDLVWSKLELAVSETSKKYGEEQAISAISKLVSQGDYNRFTNENDARFDLKNICSYKFLLQIMNEKLKSVKMELDVSNLVNYLINQFDDDNRRGRK